MVIDFTSPSQLRRFELIVEGQCLYVNQHYLAELSPYFLALCFSPSFRETQEGRVELEGISFNDMLELLHNICPGDDFTLQRRISVDNFALLTHLSERLLLTNLRRELEGYVSNEDRVTSWLSDSSTPLQLVEILNEAVSAQFNESAVDVLCKQLAKKDEQEVNASLQKLPIDHRRLIEPKVQAFVSFSFV